MDEHQGETNGQTAELAVGMTAVGDTEDHHKEHEGQQSLNEESTSHACGLIFAIACSLNEILSKTVGSENARFSGSDGFPDHKQQGTGNDTADKLCKPIDQHLLKGHATIDKYTETDSRIQVSTRDVANTIGHSDHGETEGNGYAEETDMAEERCAATSENKNECAE